MFKHISKLLIILQLKDHEKIKIIKINVYGIQNKYFEAVDLALNEK